MRDRDRYVLVRAADIDWIDAAANYVRLNTRGHGFLLRMTIAEMERRLDPAHFTRIHRSTIVNTTRVKEIRPDAHGDYDVVLIDGRTLRMSRSFQRTAAGSLSTIDAKLKGSGARGSAGDLGLNLSTSAL